jgi:serine/threonine-protein kinase
VARAVTHAPDLAITHFAAGRLAVSDGRFDDAASELALALSMAPTYAEAHDYLGMLQCEAGRGDEGERHILLARKIDPEIPAGASLARRCALAGDLDTYREMVAELKATPNASRFMIESLEMRVAGWYGDLETVRRCRPSAFVPPTHAFFRLMEAQRAGLLGEGSSEALRAQLTEAIESGAGPRLGAFVRQLAVEALVPLGDLEGAMEELRVSVDSQAFVDTEWMERCPVLDPLRSHPDFDLLTGQVHRRANAIWRVRTS